MPGFDLTEIDRLLTTTRAVRYRLDRERPVDRKLVTECVRLACYAPTQSNTQAYRWVIVDDPDQRRAVGECYRTTVEAGLRQMLVREAEQGRSSRTTKAALHLAEHMAEVPVLVIPCYDLTATAAHYAGVKDDYDPSQRQAPAMYASIYPAVWGFQLACRSRGLGTTFTTAHLRSRAAMADILGIPEGWEQSCLIPVAHTVGDDFEPASRRPVDEVVVWNRYDGRDDLLGPTAP